MPSEKEFLVEFEFEFGGIRGLSDRYLAQEGQHGYC